MLSFDRFCDLTRVLSDIKDTDIFVLLSILMLRNRNTESPKNEWMFDDTHEHSLAHYSYIITRYLVDVIKRLYDIKDTFGFLSVNVEQSNNKNYSIALW